MDVGLEENSLPDEVENRLATLSHEFKSPLAVTLSALQLIEYKVRAQCEQEFEEDYAQFFEIAKRNVYKTLRMANNFVDTGRLSAGCTTITYEAVDLFNLLENTLRTTRSYASALGAEIVLKCKVETPFVVMCDKQMIDRVILNLLSNALKHLPENNGLIEILLEKQETSAVVSIKDNGDGISQEDLPHVFEKYWHAKNPMGVDRHGSGLGLYIVQSLVELHGGEIGVESTPHQGAKFTVTLPQYAQETAQTMDAAPAVYQCDGQTLQTQIELSSIS